MRAILLALPLVLGGCHRLLPFGDSPRDGARAELSQPGELGVADGRGDAGAHDGRAEPRPPDGPAESRLHDGPAVDGQGDASASCLKNGVPLPSGTDCVFTPGFPGECDGSGSCLECIGFGSQCGVGDNTPCCDEKPCITSAGSPANTTCGGI